MVVFRRTRNKRRDVNSRGSNSNSMSLINQTSIPSYPNEPILSMVLPGSSYILSSAASTGVIASEVGFSTNSIFAFTTRYALAFDEARILKCNVQLIPLGSNSGVTAFYWSERTIAAPSVSEAISRNAKILSNSNGSGNSKYNMSWKADDFSDLTWQAINNTNPSVYFSVYTDGTNYAAPTGVLTPLWLIRPMFTVQFRGTAST
jgi:hypothetical protein